MRNVIHTNRDISPSSHAIYTRIKRHTTLLLHMDNLADESVPGRGGSWRVDHMCYYKSRSLAAPVLPAPSSAHC